MNYGMTRISIGVGIRLDRMEIVVAPMMIVSLAVLKMSVAVSSTITVPIVHIIWTVKSGHGSVMRVQRNVGSSCVVRTASMPLVVGAVN